MMSHIISFILQTFQSPYNGDFLKLICENNSSYMNKIKPFLRVLIDASEERADISKISEKKYFFVMYPRLTKFWEKSSQYQIQFLQTNCKKTESFTLFCILNNKSTGSSLCSVRHVRLTRPIIFTQSTSFFSAK